MEPRPPLAGPADVAPVGARRDFAWGFVAQIFSSATNFGLILLTGRLLGPGGLGVVVIGLGAYQLVAGLQRAFVTQPFVAEAAPLSPAERRSLANSGLMIVTCSGLVATIIVAVSGYWVSGNVGRGLLVFAPWIVVGLLQDFWKTILFQERRGAAAAASDCVRFSAIAFSLPIALLWRHDYVVVGAWGLSAAFGLVVSMLAFPVRPEPVGAALGAWRQRGWVLGRWLGARELVFQVLTYAKILMLAVILGATDLGGLRSAEALFSPYSLVAAALVLPALPALSRAAAVSHSQALGLAFRICALAMGFGLAYMVLMAFAGQWLLVHLFGQSFSPFTGLVWPMATAQLLSAAGVAFTLLLWAEKRGPASFLAGAIAAGASLLGATAFALAYGLTGAAWGFAAGSGVESATVIYLALRKRARDRGREGPLTA